MLQTALSASLIARDLFTAEEREDERIHAQVGELSAVFCIPRSRGKARFREEVFREPSELAGALGGRRGVVLECL